MTSSWFRPLPVQAVSAAIRAAEVVATGDRVGGIRVLADSGVNPLLLRVAAIRVLRVLFLGDGMGAKFDRLRAELLRVADATNAPSAEIDLALEVASAAQFWACGDEAALRAVTDDSQHSACDQASVAVQLVGMLLDDELGPQTFAELRHRFGVENA